MWIGGCIVLSMAVKWESVRMYNGERCFLQMEHRALLEVFSGWLQRIVAIFDGRRAPKLRNEAMDERKYQFCQEFFRIFVFLDSS